MCLDFKGIALKPLAGAHYPLQCQRAHRGARPMFAKFTIPLLLVSTLELSLI